MSRPLHLLALQATRRDNSTNGWNSNIPNNRTISQCPGLDMLELQVPCTCRKSCFRIFQQRMESKLNTMMQCSYIQWVLSWIWSTNDCNSMKSSMIINQDWLYTSWHEDPRHVATSADPTLLSTAAAHNLEGSEPRIIKSKVTNLISKLNQMTPN